MLQNGDLIEHALTRKERRVFDRPIGLLHEDEHYIVLNKPSSIPVHPCGPFFYNSLSMILKHELHYKNLLSSLSTHWIVGHRLDRQTSGISVFAKTKLAAQQYTQSLTKEQIHKVYIARVLGRLPEPRFEVNKSGHFTFFCRDVCGVAKKRHPRLHLEARGRGARTGVSRGCNAFQSPRLRLTARCFHREIYL